MHDKTLQEILEQARYLVQEIAVDEAYRLFKAGGQTTFLDMREPEELSLGYIKGSVFIRGDELEMQARHLLPDKEAPVVLYCGSGIRSLLTAQTLKELGYRDVRTLAGELDCNAPSDASRCPGHQCVLTLELTHDFARSCLRKARLSQHPDPPRLAAMSIGTGVPAPEGDE